MKHFKDGTLKFAILNYVLHHSGCTSEDIAQHVQHESIRVLRSEIYYLKRQSYLTVSDKKERPLRYSTTKSGQKEAQQGPHSVQIKRQERQERVQAMVSAILNDDDNFAAAVESEVRTRLKEIEAGTREPPVIEKVVVNKADDTLRQQLEAKGRRIEELEVALQHLKLHQSNVPTKVKPVEKTPEQQQAENERIKRRKRLVQFYSGKYLDSQFFEHWKEIYPYKIKFKVWHSENSVELMSHSNKEHARGHTLGKLPPQAIMDARFHIVKADDKGITIRGRGLPDGGQASLRW